MLAKVITDSGASVVAAQEIGPAQCVDLAAELGPRWSWRKAKAGINAVYWRDEWTLDG
jgi:hypothetical protein